MTFLANNLQSVPRGFRKALYFNWPLLMIVAAVCATGFLMLYSVADGQIATWAYPQIKRFALGLVIMFMIAFTPINFWKTMAVPAFILSLILLVLVEFMGSFGMGAKRWIDLGFMRLQPSELMKVALVMVLALYYDWLDETKISRPQWVVIPLILILLPTLLVIKQPDLGTAILLVAGGVVIMFLAGVSWWYFIGAGTLFVLLIVTVLETKGTEHQLLKDYQYKRIETFLDPSQDPLGDGYHITQSKIALGSGGMSGRGFMQGTQSRLNFLPEKHTDFIFTTLVEELGFLGGVSLLGLYLLIILFCVISALRCSDRFSSLLILGIAATFFFYFAVNMLMVMGLAPVVGVPLPLVSYGGSAMLVLLAAFGLVQSAHIHQPRKGI